MARNSQAARTAIVEDLIERFAPVNEDQLALLAADAQLPSWLLLEERAGSAGELVLLPLTDLSRIPHERLSGWLPRAVVGLACGQVWEVTEHGFAAHSLQDWLTW